MKPKQKQININTNQETFVSKLIGGTKTQDFTEIKLLRNLLTNEKARILYTLKTQAPNSIYALSKLLNRDFKSVQQNIKTLEKFGLIQLKKQKTGKRTALKPTLTTTKLQITLNI